MRFLYRSYPIRLEILRRIEHLSAVEDSVVARSCKLRSVNRDRATIDSFREPGQGEHAHAGRDRTRNRHRLFRFVHRLRIRVRSTVGIFT